jgi:hypothetical protein
MAMEADNMVAEDNSRRRRFRFSLLSLFLGLTAVGIALGHLQVRARERRAALPQLQEDGVVWFPGDPAATRKTPKHTVVTYCLQLFGDRPVAEIIFMYVPGNEAQKQECQEQVKQAEAIFPEAYVHDYAVVPAA